MAESLWREGVVAWVLRRPVREYWEDHLFRRAIPVGRAKTEMGDLMRRALSMQHNAEIVVGRLPPKESTFDRDVRLHVAHRRGLAVDAAP